MTVKEFDEFVERQRSGASNDGQVNWDQERDEWLAHLDALYRMIEALLGKYISSGQISVRYKPIELNERDIGSYQARQMILRIGRQEVDLVPTGTLFIGFKGLVDVIGSAGKSRLVLANKDRRFTVQGPQTTRLIKTVNQFRSGSELASPSDKAEWTWRIMPRPPGLELDEVTPENFFQLLMEVTNG
ncbi:MAG: hypothetical protein ABSD44_14740 [Terracidiphilus sp.]